TSEVKQATQTKSKSVFQQQRLLHILARFSNPFHDPYLFNLAYTNALLFEHICMCHGRVRTSIHMEIDTRIRGSNLDLPRYSGKSLLIIKDEVINVGGLKALVLKRLFFIKKLKNKGFITRTL
ncbi:hypothetical protein ACJX0J_014812, partial [Zea mays]